MHAEFRQITCIMPAGKGRDVLNRLRLEHRVIDVAFHHARGVGTQTHAVRSPVFREVDVAMILVAADLADAVFDFLYRAAGLSERRAGMVFMTPVQRGWPMQPPAGFVEY